MDDMLSNNHWTCDTFKQRMPVSTWKKILLDNNDRIIVKGCLRQLIAKKMGYGIVEVYKAPEEYK